MGSVPDPLRSKRLVRICSYWDCLLWSTPFGLGLFVVYFLSERVIWSMDRRGSAPFLFHLRLSMVTFFKKTRGVWTSVWGYLGELVLHFRSIGSLDPTIFSLRTVLKKISLHLLLLFLYQISLLVTQKTSLKSRIKQKLVFGSQRSNAFCQLASWKYDPTNAEFKNQTRKS